MKTLLTGSSGFVGHYMMKIMQCDELVDSHGYIDLLDFNRLSSFFNKYLPDVVIHLAAQSSVSDSIVNPKATYDVNVNGVFNLLSCLESCGFSGKMLYVSSSDVYGLVPESRQPISEMEPLKPRSPYAVSKVSAEAMCYQMGQVSSFETVIARPFNHIGAGQDVRFVVPDFVNQLIQIKRGLRPAELLVGDIDVSRDFTNVKDVVQGYKSLSYSGKNGEIYNICSGDSRSIRGIISLIMEKLDVDVEIKKSADRFRKSEQRMVCGDNSKIKSEIGWSSPHSFDETLNEIINYWMNKFDE